MASVLGQICQLVVSKLNADLPAIGGLTVVPAVYVSSARLQRESEVG